MGGGERRARLRDCHARPDQSSSRVAQTCVTVALLQDPASPFSEMALPEPGVYLSWESTVYPDGGMYEGLMKDGQCHGKGVFQYADGDRRVYEGDLDFRSTHLQPPEATKAST